MAQPSVTTAHPGAEAAVALSPSPLLPASPRGHACCPGAVCVSHGSWLLTVPCVCRITLGAWTTEAAVIAITPPAAFPVWIHKDAEASGRCETDWEVLQPSSGTRGTGAWPPDPRTASIPGSASAFPVSLPLGVRLSAVRAAQVLRVGPREPPMRAAAPPVPRHILPTRVRPPDGVCWKHT